MIRSRVILLHPTLGGALESTAPPATEHPLIAHFGPTRRGRCDPLIPGPQERHQQRTRCSSVQITLGERAWFVATPLFSLRENAIAKEPALSYPE